MALIQLGFSGSDDQSISLIGNSLIIEDGNTISLAPFLDDTDDQVISASLSGTNLILGIEDGNSITVPLASLNTDDQTLTLLGNNLSIEDGNTINLAPYLDNTDSQTLSATTNPVTGATNSISITGGNTVNIAHPGLTANIQPIFHERYFAYSADGITQAANRNLFLTRTAVGRWNVSFIGAHPDGVNYHPTITAEEQSNLRDTPNITVVQGSKTSVSFQIEITTGDNGGTADAYVDAPFSIGICSRLNVVTSVTQN